MTAYQPGQRIRLIHTDDAHTDLRPGALGTVHDHNLTMNTVGIVWDNGSRLSMLLDRGDRIAAADDPTGTIAAPAAPTAAGLSPQRRRDAVLTAARAGGSEAGRNAADWWGQHTVGGRTTGDVRPAARRILTGIDDGDPRVLFALPVCDRTDAALHLPDVIDAHGSADTPESPTGEELADALAAYADAYDAAAEARVVELCHFAASTTGTDLTHLHPDRVGIGAVGVFSGEWAATADGHRYATGYVGTLIGRWNGWAVFTCTRQVADAIVADHEQQRRQLRDELRDGGVPKAQLDHDVDAELARLTFDGDVLVADLSALQDDPEAIERVHPDTGGRYVVMGRIWCWEPVDPYACDRIVGDTPDAGR